jgi:hypothetical protein
VKQSQSVFDLLPAALRSKPARTFGEEKQRSEQNKTRDSLDTPGYTEGRRTFDSLGTTICDQEHDEDTLL